MSEEEEFRLYHEDLEIMCDQDTDFYYNNQENLILIDGKIHLNPNSSMFNELIKLSLHDDLFSLNLEDGYWGCPIPRHFYINASWAIQIALVRYHQQNWQKKLLFIKNYNFCRGIKILICSFF